ncbi:Plant peroxidase [Macleaya cordata]|uniref:Peroxidase n=1 Tax=Macleaya cordata TaxID=56857 RepID=A0A200RB30_MACCD|nr:Plant peroxidase [Macleaya cordata]
MGSEKVVNTMLGLVLVLVCVSVQLEAQLEVGFYKNTCESAEIIVKEEVTKAFDGNRGLAAGLVRLHFHDCFVRGCDGSVLIDSTPTSTSEKDSPANNPSLRGFEVIDAIQNELDKECKGVVSCADILAFAARDSIFLTSGIYYGVPAGRKDGRVSLASETTDLPPPTFDVDQLTRSFAKKGLTQEEMVTLSGAHTIGRSHCTSFSKRLYSFNATTSQDPSLDPNYATDLKRNCPQGSNDPNLVVPMNPDSPTTLDVGYYSDVLGNRGLFTSDQTLMTNPATANQVKQNADIPGLWQRKFVAAMLKMGQVGVLTGNAGEIRLKCRVPN